MDIISKIKKAELIGRGGACFPTALKWSAVAKAVADKENTDKKAYVICNSAEGEPGVKKDLFIWNNFGQQVIDGMQIAIDFFGAEKGYIYINPLYMRQIGKRLMQTIGKRPIELFDKPATAGYIGGEESSALNAIEGKKIEPRLRPPFPTTNGLWNCPTLINNVETFYNVSLVASDRYKGTRFYTVGGDCLWSGVYELDQKLSIKQILKDTNNWPDFPFFVQVGGDASGEVLNSSQLDRPATGAGLITVHSLEKHNSKKLMFEWVNFFTQHSCGQCTPCREGTYRLREIFSAANPDWNFFADILQNLSDTAFCGLGCALPVPLTTYIKNVLPKISSSQLKMPANTRKAICDCLK